MSTSQAIEEKDILGDSLLMSLLEFFAEVDQLKYHEMTPARLVIMDRDYPDYR